MCGIIAIIEKKTPSSATTSHTKIEAMLATLAQRGPDENDYIEIPTRDSNKSCLLGQTRLSILDITGGKQPMKDEALPITLVFNGEIYNYQELRNELKQKGHYFQTNSDTEVILKSYVEWGERAPEHLDGMFAFIVWDGRNDSLFFVRDRFGKKPLYWCKDANDSFYLASEIKALFASGEIKGEINQEALDAYLTLMYIPSDRSIYSNISLLPPAHAAMISADGAMRSWRYWELESQPVNDSYVVAKEKIKHLFSEAVRKRMNADVEVGSLLSGGVDSTLVTAYAQKFTNRPLKTFSVGYGDYINELPYAKQASGKIGTDHHDLQASPDLTEELKRVIAYFDEPHADSSNFPQQLVSELASRKVKVALSGDGADELFMGYGWYWKHRHLPFCERWLRNIFSNPFKENLERISVFSKAERSELLQERKFDLKAFARTATQKATGNIQKINLWDLSVYLPGQLLTKVDRTSMMHSLEIRSPFLDTALAEYVYNLPLEYKCNTRKGTGKIILKDILAEIMPPEFVYRRKQGFGAPVKDWLKTPAFKKLVDETLLLQSSQRNLLSKHLDESAVKRIVEDFYAGNDSLYYKVWSLLCLELWLQSHQSFHRND